MAKLTITFENGKINKKLEFQNNIFEYTMKPSEHGMIGDKSSILHQFSEMYPYDVEDDVELIEHLENIDFGDEFQMNVAMEYVSSVE